VQTDVLSDVDGTITIDFVQDSGGTDILRTLTIPYTGGDGYQFFSAPAFTPYVRYRFTADEAGQTDFYFDTKALRVALSPQILGVDAFISPKMVSSLNRSVISGKTEGGSIYNNVNIGVTDNLQVDILNPQTAFGELQVAEPVPVAQIDFVYGINDNLANETTTGSGTVTAADGLLTVSTTAAASSSGQLTTKRYIRYRPGQGAMGRFTALYTTGVADSKQYAGLGTENLSDGFFFGYDGATFGIFKITDSSETHIPQTTWNVDVMDGTGSTSNPSGQNLDPTKGNVFQIKYQYLGFGGIYFYVENSETGLFSLVHIIKYANSNTTPSLRQPALEIVWKAENTTNTTDISVKGASGALFLEGIRRYLGPKYGQDNNKTSITTETNILTIKNCTTFNGVTNRSQIRIRTISFGSNAGGNPNGITTLLATKGATLGGTPAYTPTDGSTADNGATITSGQSVASYDTAGTTITNGTVEFNEIVAIGNSSALDATELDLYINPGETLTFSIKSSSSATVGVGVSWSEDI